MVLAYHGIACFPGQRIQLPRAAYPRLPISPQIFSRRLPFSIFHFISPSRVGQILGSFGHGQDDPAHFSSYFLENEVSQASFFSSKYD